MKILITGTDGFIGKNVVHAFRQQGFTDLLLCGRGMPDEQLSSYAGSCDAVFHFAGVNRPLDENDFVTDNVEFTERLIAHLEKNPKRPCMIFTSSIQTALDNAYGRSKLQAENLLIHYAKVTGTTLYVYRLPHVFGKWCRPDYNSVVATFCHYICRDKDIVIHDESTRIQLVYIDDLIREFLEILYHNDKNGIEYREVKVNDSITLGELAKLLSQFHEERNNLGLPDFSDELTKKLYSTYLSYLPMTEFKYSLPMHKDQRGSFTEFLKTNISGQISVNISKPGIVKGHHWHHTKTEKFLVVHGIAVVKLRHMITNQTAEYCVSGNHLEVVEIPVGYTHSIINTGDGDLVTIIWANEPYDTNNPDTYFEEV